MSGQDIEKLGIVPAVGVEKTSPWDIVNDYIKTVITIATAFLAFTGTFITLGKAPFWLSLAMLLCWSMLFVTIFCALWAAGGLTNYLRKPETGHRSCLAFANASYITLAIAMLFFVLFTLGTYFHYQPNSEAFSAMESARIYLEKVAPQMEQKAMVQEMIWNTDKNVWEITWSDGISSSLTEVDPASMRVIKYQH